MAHVISAPIPGVSAPHCLDCPTRRSAEWNVLGDEEMAHLAAGKSARTYRKGELIFAQGQPCLGIYCIASGTAAVGRTEPSLPTVLVRLAHAGQTLGYSHLVLTDGWRASAKALEPSVICSVESSQLERLLKRHQGLAQRFQAHLVADLEQTEAALAHLAWQPVRSRLARLIVALAERTGSSNGQNFVRLKLPMTRRDMADLLCTRPETLTRTMQAMESDGVLISAGHRVDIPDLGRLRQESVATHLH